MEKVSVFIPFEGFYSSNLDDEIHYAYELIAEDSGEQPGIDWCKVRESLARDYVDWLADGVGLSMNFLEIQSPREYNFHTDRVRVSVSLTDLESLLNHSTTAGDRARFVSSALAPRSGFYPFYSDEIEDWGPLQGWVIAQLSLMLELLVSERLGHQESDGDLSVALSLRFLEDCHESALHAVDSALLPGEAD